MKKDYYEIDLHDVDEFDQDDLIDDADDNGGGEEEEEEEEQEVTLDNWTPTKKEEKFIIPSEWRKKSINDNHNQEPGLNDLKKINYYVKKNYPDVEIMRAFGLAAETLIAIKTNKYSPIHGISMDNLCKIQKEFLKIERSIQLLKNGMNYIAHTLFIEKEDLDSYKAYCKKK